MLSIIRGGVVARGNVLNTWLTRVGSGVMRRHVPQHATGTTLL